MNQLISSNTTLTMSSREIAAILGKQHTNIKISADRLAEKGVIAPQETPYIDPQNKQTYHEYQLTKRDSLILVAQNCPEFTAKLVDRWQELEDGASIPKTLSSALRLAADQAEIIERQSLALAVAAPKIQFVDSYVEATGIKGFREVAKLLKIKEPEFREFLSSNKIMYRLGGEWVAYQNHIDAGRFAVRAGVSQHSERAFNTCKFTPKGIEWIAGLLAVEGIRTELEAA